jgi:signal transduction histidine kinase
MISEPIVHLVETMKIVSSDKNYAVRARAESDDEIGLLMRGFNDMLGQIEARDDRLQRTAEDLNLSNEELRNFTFIFFHDLRTPMVNIKGFSGELRAAFQEMNTLIQPTLCFMSERDRERLSKALQVEVPQALSFIDSSAHQMSELLDAVLMLAKIGSRSLILSDVDMEILARTILTSFPEQFKPFDAAVTIGPLPKIRADERSMELVLRHLLENAIKYRQPGRSAAIEISAKKNAEETLFCVRDNGRGIAVNDIPKVFDLFRRVGNIDVAGQGMGLAYAKALIKRHGGRIWCESEPGNGTTFLFTIPDDGPTGSPAAHREEVL